MSTSPSRPDGSPPSEPVDETATSGRHVTDAAVADTLIAAVRSCEPGNAYTLDRLRAAVGDYVDAARARGEAHARTLDAVRHLMSNLVLSPIWVGIHRSEARSIIQQLVAFASARFYAESAYRDAQPSTAFHFEVRKGDPKPNPVTRRGWDDEG